MNFYDYFKDKFYQFILTFICYAIILIIFFAFKIDIGIIISTFFILINLFIVSILIDYFRKKKFYDTLLKNIDKLDKSYLVLETISKPNFYEGELLYQALYDINKSMSENVKTIYQQSKEFKEYIELWIHEIKIPLSTLNLINNSHNYDRRIKIQLKRINDYVEQVLYYSRSENASKDYLIRSVDLSTIIRNVGLKSIDDLLENKMNFIVDKVKIKVLTDSKWLEFILEQIINNSIKYKKDNVDSYIKIEVNDEKNKTILTILDNGIGIKESDLKQVMNKSFTGENGRGKSKSTGMGLYIVKNMCEKLSHKIEIESKENEYTKVIITFFKNNYYDVLN